MRGNSPGTAGQAHSEQNVAASSGQPPSHDNSPSASSHVKADRQLYTVTPIGAVMYCTGVFGLAVATMSVLSYRRGLSRLKAEGFAEEDVHKAVPYAAKAFGIASSAVFGAGAVGASAMYACGLDLKDEAQVASVQEAYGLVKGREFGLAIGDKVREWGAKNLWSISKPVDGDGSGQRAAAGTAASSAERTPV